MEMINKHTVMKKVRENGEWVGYIAPSNVNSYHINNGWQLGHEINIKKDNSDYKVVSNEQEMLLSDYLNNFKYYNCDSELGKRVRFWENN